MKSKLGLDEALVGRARASAMKVAEDTQRFSALSGLLFSKPEVSQFLLAEMRLQQALADIFKIVTDAAGLEIQLPG